MAKNLLEAFQEALTRTKAYIDDNHYNQTEIDNLLALKSDEDHTHNYAGSSSAGGAATSANKVNNDLVIKINGGTIEGIDLFTFNGSAAKTIDITPAVGTTTTHIHDNRYYTETEIDTKLGEVQDDIQAAVDGYEGAIEGAKTELQTAINNEATSRAHADNALDARLDVLEGSGTGSVAKALADAKSYADTKVAAVLDSAPETLDTLNELAAALGDDPNFATTLANQIGGKAPTNHASTATTYGASSDSNYGHAMASSTTPKANGTAAVGSETSSFARGDHVHPLQTSVSGSSGSCTGNAATASKVNNSLKFQLNGGTTEGTNQFTFDGSAAKTINITPSNIGASASEHTHSSYVNQNAFSNVKVGETTVAADTTTDTLTLVAGNNVTITPDATNDKITIAATDTVYTHPNSGATAGSYGNSSNQTPAYGATFNVPYITINAQGHIIAISNQTVKIPASDNTWRGIQNNLTSTSTTDSLSAAQGKILNDTKADMIDDTELTAMLTEIFGITEA